MNHQELHAYYVDRFGFTELPAFALERRAALHIGGEAEDHDLLQDSGRISFYFEECSEFHVLGECHYDLTLNEALDWYEKIPSDRRNGMKSVGFDLKDGSDYAGEFDLVIGGKVIKETINAIPYFRENVYVQSAIRAAEKELERRMTKKGRSVTADRQENPRKPTAKRREECL